MIEQVSLKFKEQEDEEIFEPPSSRQKILPKLGILASLLITVGAGAYWYYSHPQPKIIEPLRISGRIEGYETDIGAKVSGRINFVAAREGDKVSKNQVLVRQDDEEIKAQLQSSQARLLVTQQQERQAALQINIIEIQIQEIKLNIEQAKQDSQGRILEAQSFLAASEAKLNEAQGQLEEAQAQLKLAQTDYDRYFYLVNEGAIIQQQFDQAETALTTNKAKVKTREASLNSYKKLVEAAKGDLKRAKTTLLNPQIRQTQLRSLQTQLAQARLQRKAAQAEIANAKAGEKQINSKIKDLNIPSPIDGVVVSRSVEPGVVVSAGKTLLTVINPKTVYLRGYIPEGQIGKIKVGQQAKVFLDSAPDQPLNAKISAIDTQASFTPENIYFQEDRVKQVFGVKISIDNPQGLAKPGMPADAEIITNINKKK